MAAVVHDTVPLLASWDREQKEEAPVEDSEIFVFVYDVTLFNAAEHKLSQNRQHEKEEHEEHEDVDEARHRQHDCIEKLLQALIVIGDT